MDTKTNYVLLQNVRFLTILFAFLAGFGVLALLSKVVFALSRMILGEESTLVPVEQLSLTLLIWCIAWLILSFLFYQIRVTSVLLITLRKMQHRYSIFGMTFFCRNSDLKKWTWIQPKTAYIGSRKLVIDAGNENQTSKTHLIEMPIEATWPETLALGKLIADHLSIECKPYTDRVIGISSGAGKSGEEQGV